MKSSDPKMAFCKSGGWKRPLMFSRKFPLPSSPSSKQLSHQASQYQEQFQHIQQSVLLFPQLSTPLSPSRPRTAPWHFKIPLSNWSCTSTQLFACIYNITALGHLPAPRMLPVPQSSPALLLRIPNLTTMVSPRALSCQPAASLAPSCQSALWYFHPD